MTTMLCDPFQVKRLERLIKRPLTLAEREGQAPVRFKDPNGQTKFEWIKRYNIRDFYSK